MLNLLAKLGAAVAAAPFTIVFYFDQLFIDNDTIYMIEQKMRDDHDSAKKRGFLILVPVKYSLNKKIN